MLKFSHSVLLFLFLWSFLMPGLAKEYSPKIVPPNWVDSYDYQQNLGHYLSQQYAQADQHSERLYVYFYSDWSKECRQLRRKVRQARVQDVLKGIRVVMLDVATLRQLRSTPNRNNHAQKGELAIWSPVLFPVRANGQLGREGFYPGKHLGHQLFLSDYRGRNHTTSILPRAQPMGEFLNSLQNYLVKTQLSSD